MATHYEMLGVSPDADHGEIRRAYLTAARTWHPDRFVGADAKAVAKADVQMRRVNEAWSVLGVRDRRRAYDQQLGGERPSSGGRRVGVDDDGVIRIDPRLLDPELVARRRHSQLDEISNRTSIAVRVAPVFGLVALLGAIFVFTAYARSDEGVTPTTTVPGPSLGAGIEADDCVSVLSGPSLLDRPCDATADGRVVGARLPDGQCPIGTTQEVELSNGAIACLAPVT